MSNRLANAASLYLRQHGENPVDWWPWCEEAFARAREEDKPVLVSVGYSSCHWCHVMAHESFENPSIARLMNKHFVSIKVDREERPDVDQVFLEAVQMLQQHAGWPLNVFCLPDGRPFFGGTYFPPDDRGHGLIPWPQLLMRVAETYRTQRGELEENAGNIVANLRHLASSAQENGQAWEDRALVEAGERIAGSFDAENGGLGGAPKFPPTMVLQFFLALRQARACGNGNPRLADTLDAVTRQTLERMARGGLFDQVGGGFCRYCVDATWTIPHFEKMLYDNGLLLETYAQAWMRFREPLHQRVVEETIEWLEREMRLPSGLYASSLDADTPEGEGRFYCWTPEQLREVLGEEEAGEFASVYEVSAEGNFEEGLSYPQFLGELEDRDRLAGARERLREARERRPRPGRDDKVLVFWNALAARGLLTAGIAWRREDWLGRAAEILDLLWEGAWDGEKLRAGTAPGAAEGFLDDYTTLAHLLLLAAGRADTYPRERRAQWRARARLLVGRILEAFPDESGKAFCFTSEEAEAPVLRRVEWYDNATPSGNASLVHLLAACEVLEDDPTPYREALDRLRPSYATILDRAPNGVAYALAGWTHRALGVPTAHAAGDEELARLGRALGEYSYRPVWLQEDPAMESGSWRICVGSTCLPPTADPASAAASLGTSPTPVLEALR